MQVESLQQRLQRRVERVVGTHRDVQKEVFGLRVENRMEVLQRDENHQAVGEFHAQRDGGNVAVHTHGLAAPRSRVRGGAQRADGGAEALQQSEERLRSVDAQKERVGEVGIGDVRHFHAVRGCRHGDVRDRGREGDVHCDTQRKIDDGKHPRV